MKNFLLRLPGRLASLLMIAAIAFWSYWGAGEMYHEGWWGAWYNCLPYLAPPILLLIPTLIAFRWPLAGGALIGALGVFALFFFDNDVAFIGLAIALLGGAFIADGLLKRRGLIPPPEEGASWWRRHWRHTLAIGAPLVIYIAVSAYNLPTVLTRVDDGDRGARRIVGNGVDLVWAPLGPGWNWQQPWGGYPSWQDLALYGCPPLGFDDKPGYGRGEDDMIVFAAQSDMDQTQLCAYLDESGTRLLDERVAFWRMPTADEIVRSLARHGQNTGCEWDGETQGQVECLERPDKESPLWATDVPVIYYWTADSFKDSQAYFVSFNGFVNAAYKLGGNPRHGYRCVRAP